MPPKKARQRDTVRGQEQLRWRRRRRRGDTDLATYCRLTATTPLNDNYRFTLYTKATPTQEQAFNLLGINPDRTP